MRNKSCITLCSSFPQTLFAVHKLVMATHQRTGSGSKTA
jgi:hypothetical protein